MRNRRTVVIEGDSSIDPESLSIYVDIPDTDIDFIFTSRDDDLAPEPLTATAHPCWIARVAFSIDMAQLVTKLKTDIEEHLRSLTEALDKLDADPVEAMKTIEQMERELRAAKARIAGAVSAREAKKNGSKDS